MNLVSQPEQLASQPLSRREFFNRSTKALEEADSAFRPDPEMMTVAQQVAHTAQTLDWFLGGAVSHKGFDLNFEEHGKALAAIPSLTVARQMLDAAYGRAIGFVRERTPDQLAQPLPAGPVMGGQPISDLVWAMVEHTAHHRGALTVYTRMLRRVPPMLYGD